MGSVSNLPFWEETLTGLASRVWKDGNVDVTIGWVTSERRAALRHQIEEHCVSLGLTVTVRNAGGDRLNVRRVK